RRAASSPTAPPRRGAAGRAADQSRPAAPAPRRGPFHTVRAGSPGPLHYAGADRARTGDCRPAPVLSGRETAPHSIDRPPGKTWTRGDGETRRSDRLPLSASPRLPIPASAPPPLPGTAAASDTGARPSSRGRAEAAAGRPPHAIRVP